MTSTRTIYGPGDKVWFFFGGVDDRSGLSRITHGVVESFRNKLHTNVRIRRHTGRYSNRDTSELFRSRSYAQKYALELYLRKTAPPGEKAAR